MIIKKFQAYTEQDAIMKAKEEMGREAIVLNIKSIKQRGFAKLFKKDMVEITAALEEKQTADEPKPKHKMNFIAEEPIKPLQDLGSTKTDAIEEKLDNLQIMLENRMSPNMDDSFEIKNSDYNNTNFTFIQLIYSKLLENEIDERYANQIMAEIESSLKRESNLDTILSGVYQKIILKLGQPRMIEINPEKSKVLFFVGPTGVGKTTTIAKLASNFKLNKKASIAMITSDTYRIAAVEQLRTYANILDIPLKVIYTEDELNNAIDSFSDYDLIFVDTAGCSHRNVKQCAEMVNLINSVANENNRIEKDTFLVVSATTKYNDIINITKAYEELESYNLIFTKLDETVCLGNILNLKLNTGASLSYVTSGQVVPDDISLFDAQGIAKSLLGGGE